MVNFVSVTLGSLSQTMTILSSAYEISLQCTAIPMSLQEHKYSNAPQQTSLWDTTN